MKGTHNIWNTRNVTHTHTHSHLRSYDHMCKNTWNDCNSTCTHILEDRNFACTWYVDGRCLKGINWPIFTRSLIKKILRRRYYHSLFYIPHHCLSTHTHITFTHIPFFFVEKLLQKFWGRSVGNSRPILLLLLLPLLLCFGTFAKNSSGNVTKIRYDERETERDKGKELWRSKRDGQTDKEMETNCVSVCSKSI